MVSSSRHCTVRIDREQYFRIVEIARRDECAASDVIRAALGSYLGLSDTGRLSQQRLARIAEFLQLATDVIIREQYPDYRDRIIAEADKRMEQFHGA